MPRGWVATTVEGLADNVSAAITDGPFGSNLKSDHYTDAGPRVIRLQNIGDGAFIDARAHISESHFESLRKHEACADDVVVAMLGETLPRACLVPPSLGRAIVKADCVRLRVHPGLAVPSFVMFGLNSQALRRQTKELMHGVGRPRLGLAWFRSLRFPVPPLREQRRIVEAIESYLTRLDDAMTTLERVDRNLQRYRASVLKSAVEGRLVPTEATLAKRERRAYEPAPVLLERILAERCRRWSEAGRKGKYEEPTRPDITKLPDLPKGWCWATIGQVAPLQAGYAFSGSGYRKNGTRLVKGNNVRDGWMSASEVDYWPVEDCDSYAQYRLKVGDVVLAMDRPVYSSGSRATKVAMLGNEWDGALLLQRVGCFRRAAEIDSRYLYLFVSSNDFRSHIVGGQKGSQDGKDLPHVSAGTVDSCPFPFPPVAEQRRIVEIAERFLAIANDGIRSVAASGLKCTRLRRVILKWAFEGRLADQDANDEPASVLLERIKAERATPKSATRTNPRRGAEKKQIRA